MPELPTNLEIERIENLTRGFGWKLVEQLITDKEIKIVMTKPRVAEIPPGPT